jgi:hypothetical protein
MSPIKQSPIGLFYIDADCCFNDDYIINHHHGEVPMKRVYLVHEDSCMKEVLDETYESMLAGLRHRMPEAKSLNDDAEFSRLHDLLALMRLGHISINSYEYSDGRVYLLDVHC